MQSKSLAFAVALLAAPLSLVTPASLSQAAGPVATLVADPPTHGVIKQSIDGRPLAPAPLSSMPPDDVTRIDRLAGPGMHSDDAGPINSTPFNGLPTSSLSDGGSQTSINDRELAPADGSGVVPNLGK